MTRRDDTRARAYSTTQEAVDDSEAARRRGDRLARLAGPHGKRFERLCFRLALVVSLVIALFPIYWTAVVAVTPHPQVWQNIGVVPTAVSAEGIALAFGTTNWVSVLGNSILISLLTTALVLLVATPAGYVFGRLEFPGRRPLFVAVLLVAVIPPQGIALPLYRLFRGYVTVAGVSPPELFDTPAGIVLPSSALVVPLAIGLLTVFFAGVPDDLEDAARIAGATRGQALRLVILPLARPGIVSVATLVFIEAYTEYFFTAFMTTGPRGIGYTVQSRLQEMVTPLWQLAYPNMVAVASLIGLVPPALVILYMSGQLDSWLSAWGSATG